MPVQGLGILREQTDRFIKENPFDINLVRHTKVPDGAGGTTFTDAAVPPQTVRVVTEKQYRNLQRRTVSGEMLTPELALICRWDADVLDGDTFVYQLREFEVIWVNDIGYEKIAEVVTR